MYSIREIDKEREREIDFLLVAFNNYFVFVLTWKMENRFDELTWNVMHLRSSLATTYPFFAFFLFFFLFFLYIAACKPPSSLFSVPRGVDVTGHRSARPPSHKSFCTRGIFQDTKIYPTYMQLNSSTFR